MALERFDLVMRGAPGAVAVCLDDEFLSAHQASVLASAAAQVGEDAEETLVRDVNVVAVSSRLGRGARRGTD